MPIFVGYCIANSGDTPNPASLGSRGSQKNDVAWKSPQRLVAASGCQHDFGSRLGFSDVQLEGCNLRDVTRSSLGPLGEAGAKL
jgi:hypothetical protein